MNLLDIFKTSLNSLNTNKLRSSLTLLGIVIGILSVISLMGMGKGFEKSVTDSKNTVITTLETTEDVTKRIKEVEKIKKNLMKMLNMKNPIVMVVHA